MSSSSNAEVPYQKFSIIKRNVLSKRRLNGGIHEADLFVDPSFPPDLSSLTYVYTGDDRYEKMVFKRPKNIETGEVTFCGVGGKWDAQFPWKTFKKRDWFQAAIVVVSLQVRYLEKIVPGYRNFEQNFLSDYIGAFRFNIWRFGEWIESIVDDYLPCFQNDLLYCKAYGHPPEYWGPLLEKAYAKIMKTYESIEVGNILHALSDLTGNICELYHQDINPPENLFYIIYKSYVNRSMMVCWRNEKRLTHTGFHHDLQSFDNTSFEDDNENQTRYLHIITATARFPTSDGRLLEMVRLKCPYTSEPTWHGKFSDSDQISWGSVCHWFTDKYKPLMCKDNDEYWMMYEDFRCNFGGLIILSSLDPFRTEGYAIDRISDRNGSTDGQAAAQIGSNFGQHWNRIERPIKDPSSPYVVKRTHSDRTGQVPDSYYNHPGLTKIPPTECFMTMIFNARKSYTNNNWKLRRGSSQEEYSTTAFAQIENMSSQKSLETDSCNGELLDLTDLPIVYRRKSVPILPSHGRSFSSNYLTHSSFLATKRDNFRSRGGWTLLLEHRGRWFRDCNDVINCPRVTFTITKPDLINEMTPQSLRGKSHVIVSVLQDYRRCRNTGNSQVVPIGLFVYKCKVPECKDFAKHKFIGHYESRHEEREITARLDLDEGSYILAPYVKLKDHESEFIVRVLGEKHSSENSKNGCMVS